MEIRPRTGAREGARRRFCNRTLVAAVLSLLFGVSLACCEKVTLRSVVPPGSPEIQDKLIVYYIKFVFDRCPRQYWSYPDEDHASVIVEMYDCTIKVDDSLKLQFVSPLRGVEVKNAPTSIVLSGQKAQILVHLKEEMHSEPVCREDTLVLRVWKELPSGRQLGKKRSKVPLISAIILLLCATITVLYIRAALNEQ